MQCNAAVFRRMHGRALALICTAVFVINLGSAGMAWSAGTEDEGRRVALVVGNAAYASLPALVTPVADARELARKLEQLGFDVDLQIDATNLGIERSVRRFANRLVDAKVGLFYYAGHSLQVDGVNYMAPVDAEVHSVADLKFELIPVDIVIDQMELEDRINLVFLDACRNNPLPSIVARDARNKTRSVSATEGLAEMKAAVGTLIAYSTQPGNVAEDGKGDHSPFSSALLAHLEEPGLEVRQMLSRVRKEVVEATNGRQVPWDHSSLMGDFYFRAPTVQAAVPHTRASAAVDERALELTFWESIKDSELPGDFQAYLDQFPNGTFVPLAERRLAAFRKSAESEAAESAVAGVELTGKSEDEKTQIEAVGEPVVVVSLNEPVTGDAVGDGDTDVQLASRSLADEDFEVSERLGVGVPLKNTNFRRQPRTGGDRLGILTPKDEVKVLGTYGESPGFWLKVERSDGLQGFVYGELIQTEWLETTGGVSRPESSESLVAAASAREIGRVDDVFPDLGYLVIRVSDDWLVREGSIVMVEMADGNFSPFRVEKVARGLASAVPAKEEAVKTLRYAKVIEGEE